MHRAPDDDRRAWLATCALLGLIAIAKGLRLPSLWAATQMEVNYDFGFVKRGLFGALLSLLRVPASEYVKVLLVSGAVLLVMLVLLVWQARASGAFPLIGRGAAVAVFCSSYALTYLVHCIGYFDICLLALTLATVIATRTLIGGTVLVAAAAIVGVLIHEMYALVFFPVTVLPLLLRATGGNGSVKRIVPLAVLTLLLACLVIFIASGPAMTGAQIDAMRSAITARADFLPRQDFFEVLSRSLLDNVMIMYHKFGTVRWWIDELGASLAFLPTAGFFLGISLGVVARFHPEARRRLVYAGIVVASLSPALMQFLGWDIYRWYALLVVNSFIVMTIVSGHYLSPARREFAVEPLSRYVVPLIGVNMATGVGLFDNYTVATFPFGEHILNLINLLSHHWTLPLW